jgi:hypothetical protein
MSLRVSAWLAWSLAALSVPLFVASISLCILARSAHVPKSWGVDLTASGLLVFLPFLAFPIVGALIASRRPENSIGWICLETACCGCSSARADYYSVYGAASPGSVPFPTGIAGLNKD